MLTKLKMRGIWENKKQLFLILSTLSDEQRSYALPLEEEEASVLLIEGEIDCCAPSVWNLIIYFLKMGELKINRVSLSIVYPDKSLGCVLLLQGHKKTFAVEIGKTEGLFLAKRLLEGEIEGSIPLLQEFSLNRELFPNELFISFPS